MQKQTKPFQFNLPTPIRIKQYIPVNQFLDYAHPNYLYQGNKYRTEQETKKILLDQRIVAGVYGVCFREGLEIGGSRNMVECYKEKLAIFRDILQILNQPIKKDGFVEDKK